MSELASSGQLRAALLRWALVLVPGIVLLGFLSAAVGGNGVGDPWFDNLAKPAIYPPPATFGIVWTALYVLMGLALAIVVTAWGARRRGLAIAVFAVQLLINLAWSPLFFAAHRISGALLLLVVLDAVVMVTVVAFYRIRPKAAFLLAPYLAWILFATVLNWQFLELNPDADGRPGPSSAVRVQL
jgi:tryptophan-rich sensory protein